MIFNPKDTLHVQFASTLGMCFELAYSDEIPAPMQDVIKKQLERSKAVLGSYQIDALEFYGIVEGQPCNHEQVSSEYFQGHGKTCLNCGKVM